MNDYYYGKLIAELNAHIEDRERTVNDMSDEIATYERLVNICSATLTEQHETIERQRTRIAELESQLTAALASIEAATGHACAEGCAP